MVDSDRESFEVTARWSINECRFNFSCFEVLGYIIQCLSIGSDRDEIRKIMWRNELEVDQNNSFGETVFFAKAFRTYTCRMAAVNSFGAGLYGSTTDVKIPQQRNYFVLFVIIQVITLIVIVYRTATVTNASLRIKRSGNTCYTELEIQ